MHNVFYNVSCDISYSFHSCVAYLLFLLTLPTYLPAYPCIYRQNICMDKCVDSKPCVNTSNCQCINIFVVCVSRQGGSLPYVTTPPHLLRTPSLHHFSSAIQ